MPAKAKTLSLLGDKPFEQQCSFCEQVYVTDANLLKWQVHISAYRDPINLRKACQLDFCWQWLKLDDVSFALDYVTTSRVGFVTYVASILNNLHLWLIQQSTQEAVNLSLANLLTFPFIEERLQSGHLQIYGMHYDFVEGRLTSWRIEQKH